jgi:hypothetical protein
MATVLEFLKWYDFVRFERPLAREYNFIICSVFLQAAAGSERFKAPAGPALTGRAAQLDAEAKLRADPLMSMMRKEHEAKLEVHFLD